MEWPYEGCLCVYSNNLERHRVVRRPPLKNGAAVHVEQAGPCGQCSSWIMVIRVASTAAGACRSVWPVQHWEHAKMFGQCETWSVLIRKASAAGGACRSVWPVQHLEHVDLPGECNTWGMLICVASATLGAS